MPVRKQTALFTNKQLLGQVRTVAVIAEGLAVFAISAFFAVGHLGSVLYTLGSFVTLARRSLASKNQTLMAGEERRQLRFASAT